MDIGLTMTDGRLVMSLDEATDARADVLLSLFIKRGTLLSDLSFGSRLHTIKKLTAQSAGLAAGYCMEATQWLTRTKKAKAVEAFAERDTEFVSRLNLSVAVTWANGETVTYQTYYEVV